jgi:ParB-like chromosome segregation protein Spo0J
MANERNEIDLPLELLRPHPRNAEVYRQRSQAEIMDLAADMTRNGQLEAVEVVPDGSGYLTVSGHGRWQAAQFLGWPTLRCWVRDDLAEAGPEAVEIRLIEANLYRRQLSRLDLVRSYRELKRLARNKRGKRVSEEQAKGDLRDLIGKRFNPPVSGRTLDRWLQVLDLPMPVQEAVEHGEVKLTDAVKLAGLNGTVKEKIAKELAEGKPACVVLSRHLDKAVGGNGSDAELAADLAASRALDRLLKALVRGLEDLGPRVNDLRRIAIGDEVETLKKGKQMIGAVIARIEENRKREAEGMDEEE